MKNLGTHNRIDTLNDIISKKHKSALGYLSTKNYPVLQWNDNNELYVMGRTTAYRLMKEKGFNWDKRLSAWIRLIN